MGECYLCGAMSNMHLMTCRRFIPIELKFYDVKVPDVMSKDHASKGGKGIWMRAADLIGQLQLRLMIGNEPMNPDGKSDHKLHISMTVGIQGQLEAFRRATEQEAHASLALYPDKKFEEDNVGNDPRCRHFWEARKHR